MKKSILFVLPRPTEKITGGYQVVFEYANELANKNYDVSIIYDCSELGQRFGIKQKRIKKLLGKYLLSKSSWFKLAPTVKELVIGHFSELQKLKADLVIATAVNTVETVYDAFKYSTVELGYLIQDYEKWDSQNQVEETYSLPMHKIVVSNWLYELVSQFSKDQKIYYCPNGIDTQIFNMVRLPEQRFNHSISFLYHEMDQKDPEALKWIVQNLKKQYNDLKIYGFGAYDKPDYLGEKDCYIKNANKEQLKEIYNKSAVFLSTSKEEGFGLTGAEAMASGCALVTTKTNGSLEYITDENSISCMPGDKESLLLGVKELFDNTSLRYKLALQGEEDLSNLSLSKAKLNFVNIVDSILKEKNER